MYGGEKELKVVKTIFKAINKDWKTNITQFQNLAKNTLNETV